MWYVHIGKEIKKRLERYEIRGSSSKEKGKEFITSLKKCKRINKSGIFCRRQTKDRGNFNGIDEPFIPHAAYILPSIQEWTNKIFLKANFHRFYLVHS